MSSKRKVLTLQQKYDAIKLLDSGRQAYKIAADLGVGKTQIQTLRKRKAEVLDDYANSSISTDSKRRKYQTGNEELNTLTYKWFIDAVARRLPVSGPVIKARALKFAEELGKTDFRASNGWLESFIKRNNIVFGTMSGERGDLNKATVSDWKEKLGSLCDGYDEKDIFNMDESGLFFKDTSRKTFYTKGKSSSFIRKEFNFSCHSYLFFI